MLKKFFEWIGVKERIHNTEYVPPLFKEGEIWWCHAGENVGVELNGKGEKFTRPFLIFKKYSRYSFLGLPLTTKMKVGTWYTTVHFGGTNQNIILAQGRVFDYRRLKEKMGELEESESEKVREGYTLLHSFHKNRPSVVSDEGRG
jgi:mRNA-degrading endonuclease toxin of MazEF toxin-antitoxin module